MRFLNISLELTGLDAATHVWFPAPQGKFSITPTKIQTDKKYGNKIVYFFFRTPVIPSDPGVRRRSVGIFKIKANFPVSGIATSSRHGGTPRNDSNKKQFLRPNRFVQSDDTAAINIAKTLTKNCSIDEEKARRCFNFVVDYLSYANPIRGLYSSVQALTDRSVDCGGFSTLLVALLRAIGIPARCVFGWAIRSKYGYHAWVEHYDRQQKTWIPSDPSVAHVGTRTKLDAGFGFIHDERVTLSVGEDLVLEGNGIKWPTPLLQSPVVVSLNRLGLPVAPSEKLQWKTLY